jgi:AcrR family transcriptional regulator
MARRQESIDDTRQRIAKAAFELHSEIGPSRTTISAVAERAGVQRHTVYSHYPDLRSLFQACSQYGLEVWGGPSPATWLSIPDPGDRLRVGLAELYGIYRRNAPGIANILRDLPAYAEVGGDEAYRELMAGLFAALADGWADASTSPVRLAAIGLALRFETWKSLTDSGLTDDQARDLMVDLVTRAGSQP